MSTMNHKPLNREALGLPRDLGDGLVLRWGKPEDADALAEFNARLLSDSDQPEEGLALWTLDLMRNDHHPTTQADDFTVVVDKSKGGKIVSALTLISQTWAYDGIPFGAGRPEAVSTEPEYRRRGLVRMQLDLIHQRSALRGELLQAIGGIPWYYRQFGYEMALSLGGSRRLFWNNVSELAKDEAEVFKLRSATLADIEVLRQLYAIHSSPYLVTRVRNAAEWHYELTAASPKSIEYHSFFLIEDLSGTPVGYFEMAYHPNALAVREIAVRSGQNLRLVCEFLTRALKNLSDARAKTENKETAFPYLAFNLGAYHPVYVALGQQLERQLNPDAWYIRIADLPAFLRRIAPALEKRLQNSVMESYSGTLRLNFYRSHLTLVFEEGKLLEVGTYQPEFMQDGDALFPDQTFLQLLLGYHSLDELRQSYPDLYPQNERAAVLLDSLFPKRPSLISPLN